MDINQSPAQAQPTGSIYAALRLGNDAQPDVEETEVEALIDMRILHLCICVSVHSRAHRHAIAAIAE